VLTALDLKLSLDTDQMDTRRRHLEVYVDAMKLYRKKYDGTEEVSEIIEQILADAEPQTRSICARPRSTLACRNLVMSSKSRDWGDILSQNPKLYLRLTLALDMSFSRGKFPHDCDFPVGCRIAQLEDGSPLQDSPIEVSSAQAEFVLPTAAMEAGAWEMLDMKPSPSSNFFDDMSVNLDFADLFEEYRCENLEKNDPSWLHEVSHLFDSPA
jgi:hypothetical protein